jgi:hypothetical protein
MQKDIQKGIDRILSLEKQARQVRHQCPPYHSLRFTDRISGIRPCYNIEMPNLNCHTV